MSLPTIAEHWQYTRGDIFHDDMMKPSMSAFKAVLKNANREALGTNLKVEMVIREIWKEVWYFLGYNESSNVEIRWRGDRPVRAPKKSGFIFYT